MPQPTPRYLTTPFANGAASSSVNVIPIVPNSTPGDASYQLGFPPVTALPPASGGIPPNFQDFNGLGNDITANIAALTAGQFYPYNATVATAIGGYGDGAILLMANGNGLWLNASGAPNSTNPDTGGAGWIGLAAYNQTSLSLANAPVTLTSAQAASNQILLSGTLTGNIQIIFPAWVTQWFIFNDCVQNGNTITAKLSGSTGVVLPPGGCFVSGSGTDILYATNYVNTFLGTYVGGTTAPAVTCYFTVSGRQVTITIPLFTATSNNAAFQMTGLPAILVPGLQQYSPIALAQNAGAFIAGATVTAVLSGPNGVLDFGFLGGSTWTTSGVKSVQGTFTYNLVP